MKIKIMECSWDRKLENKMLCVQKVPTKEPTIKQLLVKLIERVDKIEYRIDKLEKKFVNMCKINNLKFPHEN